MENCLIIFAAGKSSRFGGFPKAFCSLGPIRNIENTIRLAEQHFDRIYLSVNKETLASGITDGLNANIVSIVTGQGDADSILKTVRLIKNDLETDIVTACWGDAVFLSDKPFQEIKAGIRDWSACSPALAGCAMDASPYAWFDVEDKKIVLSHFKKREGTSRAYALHDQSIFAFRIDFLIPYLEHYKRFLGLDQYSEDSYDEQRGEMGLLDAFSWFYEQPDLTAAEYCTLAANEVMGFNTAEELDSVVEKLDKRKIWRR